ncbi:MAG: DUF4276 family protein [Candidatus Brocadiaceae bacterium]|nr:DUF4276 family protein [Candidatus Brocadiaceae bacterium]
MVRLAISVEGPTEERFVKMVMVPYLLKRSIYADPIKLGSRGGDVYLPRIKRELTQLAKSFDKVTTLYDFYGFRGKAGGENKASLEDKIMDCIAAPLREKIIPYVQMYEFEGILFSSPEAMENNIYQTGLADWANEVLQRFGGDPEKINDSPQTAPSKRLLNETNYIKTIHGPKIAKEIGLTVLREKCTGFGEWLNKLEVMGN